ncbi:MAG: zf-HC2 domain-containing protein [Verrucomicrobia bacterium]|nr:zf-HC2 domain-containing protein [Verrucomicrobiota bacterium]
MNHPTREEWLSYLYDELPGATKAELVQHLDSCPACRKSVSEWQSAMGSLDRWKLPTRSLPLFFLQPALKWAVAAVFAVGLGYGFGRFSAPAAKVETLRAGIENSLRASLETEIETRLREKYGRQFNTLLANAEARLMDRMDTLAAQTVRASVEQTQGMLSPYNDALKNFDTRLRQQGTEIGALRQDTERMALLTEVGFRRNEQQLVRLANFNTLQE